ncbi:microcin ABC transporter ATP-binding protein [Paraburkholderia tropica]|nr:microcin ABC transporter ATP-binding protein [Paraburkholderia tropica]
MESHMDASTSVSSTVLSVENLTIETAKTAGTPLVRNVSFNVRSGETVCIVGESGSGKSVTSLAIMGLLPKGGLCVTQGKIIVDGEDLLEATPKRMRQLRATRIAMVFQEPMTALNPVQRVGKQIDEVLRLHTPLKHAARKEKILAMLERVRLPDVSRIYDAFPHELSGGQRQRIVIAMALILRPRLLIADEPTTALDVTTQKEILSLIRELQDQASTAVIFITHDFGVVSDIADRVVVMNRGSLVEANTRQVILESPQEAYTRMLVSSVPSLQPRHTSAPDRERVLEVIGLDKRYEERRLIKPHRTVNAASNVSFSVGKGEITGIIGESGSGKTTVARCVIRLLDPSSGSIFLNGDDLARQKDLHAVRKRVQYIFQDPYRSLNPRRTVGQSIIEGLVNYGMTVKDAMRKAASTMELVGLSAEMLNRYPHQFSGGQRQRICIARAVVMEPDLLVADEAVSALDVSVQAQVLKLFEEIRDVTGAAILFITHDLRVAAQICNTIVVMQQGSVIEAGDATQILLSPQQEYTRKLIDAAPASHWDFQNFRPIRESPSQLRLQSH